MTKKEQKEVAVRILKGYAKTMSNEEGLSKKTNLYAHARSKFVAVARAFKETEILDRYEIMTIEAGGRVR